MLLRTASSVPTIRAMVRNARPGSELLPVRGEVEAGVDIRQLFGVRDVDPERYI